MTLLPAELLGRYGCVDAGDNDAWEGGARHLTLAIASGVPVFSYAYESRSNHGYTLASERGVVVELSEAELVVELRESTASGWEDMYKEDHDERSTERRRKVIARTQTGLRYDGHAYTRLD